MENKIIVTVVDGVGIVEAKNDLAQFTLTIRSKGDALENAVSQVQEKTGPVLKMLKDFKSKGMKFDSEVETTSANYRLEHREGSEKFPAGFQSINTISFTVVVDNNLNELNKACLKFDKDMGRPYFSVKDRDVLLEQAIEKATTDVKSKLIKECSLLNVSPSGLKIQNWNFGYEGYLPTTQNHYMNSYAGITGATGPQGAIGSIGPGAHQGPMAMKIGTTYQELLDFKLEPGSISVKVAVRVNYVWND